MKVLLPITGGRVVVSKKLGQLQQGFFRNIPENLTL